MIAILPPSAVARNYKISPRNAEKALKAEDLQYRISFLCDPVCGGRATGTPGGTLAACWISEQFRISGLIPPRDGWFQGFQTESGAAGHNVIGFLPGSGQEYVIVMSHFDHLGKLNGILYPGADNNASGVSAMISLSQMLSYMARIDKPYGRTVIFVALDGKERNMGGSRELYRRLRAGAITDPSTGRAVSKDKVAMVINLDQIGSSLSPIRKGHPDYLIMLTDDGSGQRSLLSAVNRQQGLNLDLGFTYYGSRDFTRLFFRRVCDQKVFLEAGMDAILFTSGITMNNNKPHDLPSTLDIPVLLDRIRLIYYWLSRSL